VLAALAILASRKHYTIDILLAYWVTNYVFWSYHTALILYRNETAHCSNIGLYPFFVLVEVKLGALSKTGHFLEQNSFENPLKSELIRHLVDAVKAGSDKFRLHNSGFSNDDLLIDSIA